MFNIRFANENDALGILEIYSPYVAFSSVTFEMSVPRPFEIQRRINSITNKYPWLICEKDGVIAGYAYAHEFDPADACKWNAEVEVYIKDDFQRCNIASALYYALLELLKNQGFYVAYAKITMPNDKSLAFHNAFGFVQVGHLLHAGYKLSGWHEAKILEKPLAESFDKPPRDIIPISEIDADLCKRLFCNAEKIIKER